MSSPLPDRRPEWLKRKHARGRDDPYPDTMQEALAALGGHDGSHAPVHEVVIRAYRDDDGAEQPITSLDEAKAVQQALYRSHRYQGLRDHLSLSAKPRQASDGTWEVPCTFYTKDAGYKAMADRPRDQWSYDPGRRETPPRQRRTAPGPAPGAAPEPTQAAGPRTVKCPGCSAEHPRVPGMTYKCRQCQTRFTAGFFGAQPVELPAETPPKPEPGPDPIGTLKRWLLG